MTRIFLFIPVWNFYVAERKRRKENRDSKRETDRKIGTEQTDRETEREIITPSKSFRNVKTRACRISPELELG